MSIKYYRQIWLKSQKQHFNYKLQQQTNRLSNISPYRRMSFRQSSFHSEKKDNLPATDVKTHRKNEFSFASPMRNTQDKHFNLSSLKFRSPLRDQEIQDYNRIKTQLKRGIQLAKQNISLNQSCRYVSIQEYNALNEEHKYETERLLFQIQKLHQSIHQVERNKNIEIYKLKEEHEQMSYLNLSNVRQNHTSQVDLLQIQLRKVKQVLNDKTSEYDNTIKRQQRQIKHLTNETHRLNSQLRSVIDQKNTELESQQKSAAQVLTRVKQTYEYKQKDLQENYSKELNSLRRLLQNKESKVEQYLNFSEIVENQNGKLMEEIENKKAENLQKITEKQHESQLKYTKIKQSLQEQFNALITQINKNYHTKQEFLESQVLKLKKFLTAKNHDRQKLLLLHEQRIQFVNELKKQVENQNQEIKDKLYESQQDHMQALQILKVKMSALHINDMNSVVESYQTKMQSLLDQIKQKQADISRLRKNLYEQTNHRLQMRKKYSIEVSKLNGKVIKLRSGINAMEVDMKQKVQNERSMMLLTSRSIIKDVESKTQNYKFYEEELRKLRQLFDLQQKEVQSTNIQVQEKIKTAEQELQRLSKKIIDEKNHHLQTENQYKTIIKNKDGSIEKLKQQLQNIKYPEFDNSKQLSMIDQLKTEIHDRNLENGKLRDQCSLLEKKINIMKAQIDQYEIENQITQQEAKNEYQRISHENMQEFRKFYEGRIASLEKDKQDLKQLISSKQEKITSLVQKYQQLQKAMKSTISKINKRSELQTRVMNLGMDNNLIKNMAEIVRNNLEQSV